MFLTVRATDTLGMMSFSGFFIQPVAQTTTENCNSQIIVMDGTAQKVALCADDPIQRHLLLYS